MDTVNTIYVQFAKTTFWGLSTCAIFNGADLLGCCSDGDMVAITSSSPISVKIDISGCLEKLEITLFPGIIYYINKTKKAKGQSAKVFLDRTELLAENNRSLVKAAISLDEQRQELARSQQIRDYAPTKSIMVNAGFGTEIPVIAFDDIRKQWLVTPYGKLTYEVGKEVIYSYYDIVNFELIEDGESIVSGGVGRALVGGVLFGGVGAIVGGVTGTKRSKSVCTNMQIKVTVKDINNPVVYIVFYSNPSGLRKDDSKYERLFASAQECISIFQVICESQKPDVKTSSSSYVSSADEIMKYKDLLDKGAITTDEYEAKKKQLLNL